MSQLTWLDRTLYPFRSHWLDVGPGRMHFVDEGEGPTIVLVHGTPTWSFLYRGLIQELASSGWRVIAPDHLGFGLSDRPAGWSYRPEDHARNLEMLIDRLDLRDIVLAVHDFGGPIGLSYALRHPDAVRGLVLFNTWMWSLRGTPTERVSRFMAGAVGRFLYTRMNISPRALIPAAFGDRKRLSKAVHRHYIRAFPTPDSRMGSWILAGELIGSTDWYEALWAERDRLADKPALLLWGMKDPAFGPEALERWEAALPNARPVRFVDAGHFVPEEAGKEASWTVKDFLDELELRRATGG